MSTLSSDTFSSKSVVYDKYGFWFYQTARKVDSMLPLCNIVNEQYHNWYMINIASNVYIYIILSFMVKCVDSKDKNVSNNSRNIILKPKQSATQYVTLVSV